jgi:azurin
MKNAIIASLVILAGTGFTGCGKSEKAASAPAASAPAADNVRTIEITANDQMKFNVSELHVKAGEKVRVTLANIGTMPKQAMAHNWVLLKPMSEGDITAFTMAAMPKAPEYLPDDKSAILAHTKLLGAGERDTIEFTAPAAGSYPFLCSFPGHAALMKGKLISE